MGGKRYNEAMLIDCYRKICEFRVIKALRTFLDSSYYTALIILLMLCSNLFSLELPVYYCFIGLGILCVLVCDDLKGIIPLVGGAYMSVSAENNPAVYPANAAAPSIFYDPQFKMQFTTLLVVGGVLMVGRLLSIIILGGKKKKPALTVGFAVLGGALVMGGLFTEYYDLKTAMFGLIVTASLGGMYLYFYYGVNWKKISFDEWAKTFTIFGIGAAIELIGIYVKSGSTIIPITDRGKLVTGWGMYNNVGCILAMCVTAPLYLALKKKHGSAYAVLSFILYLALLFTQSRSSILFGTAVFIAGIVIMLVKSEGKARRSLFFVILAVLAVVAALVTAAFCIPALREKVIGLFGSLFNMKLNDNGRFDIYDTAIEQFKQAPVFGVGFYQCTAQRWGNLSPDAFLPPRYHSTILQLLASGGIVALACYLVHRVETLVMLFRRPSVEKTFIFLSIAAILLTSLFDCHLFNFGPALLYGTLLAYAEGSDLKRNS